ncbi:MAG: imidazole glycerol phosphate synthase subunit HisH [Deltaproteobacteria bacterium]|nr:imidazole glycerol phosphate synthase subunit HisH [Deltaproteobacteria bacterium]
MITIVDYNAGNLRSVKRACDAVGIGSELTQDPEAVIRAERIVFPGVGNAASAMRTLEETGLAEAIKTAFYKGIPILGICLGAQIILERSEEGEVFCLGVIRGVTRRFALKNKTLKIPHMGWNEVRVEIDHPLLNGIQTGDEFYFVHSYFPDPADPIHIYATTDYGRRFCSALGKDNLFAAQFHPEKSGRLGLEILKRFAAWEGSPC